MDYGFLTMKMKFHAPVAPTAKRWPTHSLLKKIQMSKKNNRRTKAKDTKVS
jgi:hypothetical protein